LAPPYYSQRAVFASSLSAFFDLRFIIAVDGQIGLAANWIWIWIWIWMIIANLEWISQRWSGRAWTSARRSSF